MTNPDDIKQRTKNTTYGSVNRAVKALMAEAAQENVLQPANAEDNIARLLKIYAGIKPLLALISTLAVLPRSWRSALRLFLGALDAVALGAEFKAGKDL
jgi:hypothetical protein